MKAVCYIMDEMHTKKGEQDRQDLSENARQASVIKQLSKENEDLARQLGLITSLGRSMSLRRNNENSSDAKALRDQVTKKVLLRNKDLLEELSNQPITQEMFSIVAGSEIKEDGLKALRMLSAEQIKDIVQRYAREEFIAFYEKEIVKARKMGMLLAQKQMDQQTGKPTIKASEKFLQIMQEYFTRLVEEKSNGFSK